MWMRCAIFCVAGALAGVTAVQGQATNTLPGSGNVGIGTASPVALLSVQTGSQAPSTSGNASNGVLVSAGSGSPSLNFGVKDLNVSGQQYGWLQTAYTNNAGIPGYLSLNPNGGNVGIGTTAPRNGFELALRDGSYITSLRIGGVMTGNLSVPVQGETSRHQILFSSWRDVVPDTVGAKIAAINRNVYGANNALVQNTDLTFSTLGTTPSSSDNTYEVMRLNNAGGNQTSVRIGGIMSGNLSVPVQGETSRHQILFSSWRDIVPDTIGAKIVAINKNVYGANNALVQNTDLAFYTLGTTPGTNDNTTEVMRITNSGNLQLASGHGGSVVFSDGTAQSTAWTGSLCGGDYAESIDVSDDRKNYEPGDLLVIDPKQKGKFLKSASAYSKAIAGVYSTKPGVVGRRQTTPKNSDEIPMAVIGIVPAKVSTENGPIEPGDILVSSSIPGYAMKGTDSSRIWGAIVGKAMESLDAGRGTIEILVTLQ